MTETAIYVLIRQAVLTGTAFFVSAYIFFCRKKKKTVAIWNKMCYRLLIHKRKLKMFKDI